MKKIAVFGLGNYGEIYVNTRHNIGFDIIKEVSENCFSLNNDEDGFKSKKEWEILTKETKNESEIFFVKVKGFINDSGILIKKFMKSLNLSINDIILIYDDVSMEFGKVRFRKSGSSGGHNGVKSVIENLVSEDFCRIKIGVDGRNSKDLKKWVLSKFSKEENGRMSEISKKVASILLNWIEKRRV